MTKTVLALLVLASALWADDEALLPMSEKCSFEYDVAGSTVLVRFERDKLFWVMVTSVGSQVYSREWLRAGVEGIQILKMKTAQGTFDYPEPLLLIPFPATPGKRHEQAFEANGKSFFRAYGGTWGGRGRGARRDLQGTPSPPRARSHGSLPEDSELVRS